ncbi:MAG: DNA internalization-related competence protein ComEC/Rec2 [Methylotenera sp.]
MIFFALAFVFGAFCLQQMPVLPGLYWALLLVPFALIHFRLQYANQPVLALLKRPLLLKVLRIVFGFLSGLLLGFFWAATFATVRLGDALPHAWENKPVEIIGVVASVPELTERGERFRFDVEKVLTDGAVIPRHISLSFYPPDSWGETQPLQTPRFTQFKAGERWQFTARLKRPHGVQNPHVFDFESWALAENVRATGSIKAKADNKKIQDFVWRPKYVVEHVRELIKQRIAQVLANKPYTGIIQALVIGDDSQIAVDDWQLFLRTGTSHLMSISGLHITMLSGLAFGLVGFIWRRIPSLVARIPVRKAATLAGVLAALIYALIAGFSVPTQRTLYMLAVFAFALWSGRQLIISQVLALALLVVVMIDPWSVISAGFWLSFGAVAMLSFALGARVGQTHWFKASVQTQWAVTIGMVPLLLIMFHQASIISPVANAFAIPLISFFVTPLALLGSFLPIDAPLDISYQVLNICMLLLKWLNQLPAAVWQQHAPATWTLFPAVVGVMWLLLPRGVPMRWIGWVGLLPMLLIAPVRPVSGDMKVTVLDVGQGLSVVVQTATHTLLYDAGAKFNEQSDAGGRIVVPFLQGEGVRKLEGFVVSHNDTDHSGGMASVLTQMPVDWLASSLPEAYELTSNVERIKCFAGQSWAWDGVDFEMLHPQFESYGDLSVSDNNRSCVLKITSATGSLLLAGDIEKETELALVASQETTQDSTQLKSDVMVAPHHGSKTSSSDEFVAAVQPSVSIFTSGYLNRFKHPRPEVVARYNAIDSLMFRSDYHGAVMIDFVAETKVDGIKVASWRKQNKRYWHDTFNEKL